MTKFIEVRKDKGALPFITLNVINSKKGKVLTLYISAAAMEKLRFPERIGIRISEDAALIEIWKDKRGWKVTRAARAGSVRCNKLLPLIGFLSGRIRYDLQGRGEKGYVFARAA